MDKPYSAYGKQQIKGTLRTLGIAEARHTRVAGIEHQVFELVAFIDKKMVYTHHLEIHHIVGAVVYQIAHLLQLRLQIVLALFQTFEHGVGNLLALFFKDFEVFLHCIKLGAEYTFL